MKFRKRLRNLLGNIGMISLVLGASHQALAQSEAPTSASAENQSSTNDVVEEIVVTGSSLRGAPPVGTNVIVLGVEALEDNGVQTVQQLLQTVPQIWGMNAAGQGTFASFDASGLAVPQIHGIGGANSSSTLVVIDGHRFPLMGVRRNLADPNFIPPNAIQQVEILPEGASSIYGSDAVAGVINFITHKKYEGAGFNVQKGFGDSYDTWAASASLGHRWDDGGVAVFYNYSDRGDLLGAARPLTLADQTARGGRNFGNFNCGPTTFQPTGSSQIYLFPYATGMSNAQAGAPCEQSSVTAMIPEEERHSLMVKADRRISDKLNITGDIVYSDRTGSQQTTVGNVTGTVFGPGSGMGDQINPFFVVPTGTAATSGTVRFNGDELFPGGAEVASGHEIFYVHGDLEYDITDNWSLNAFFVSGMAISSETRTGELCGACVLLSLNGTTNGNGTLGLPAIPDSDVFVSNLPLTVDNAVDLWNPRASNLTSASVLQQLTDSRSFQKVRQEMQQFNLMTNGSLFSMPAGDLRVALGVDLVKMSVDSEVAEPNNTGPSSVSSSYNAYLYERTVKSVFAEVLIPVISADMDIPFVRRLEFNLSGRYDHYDEFGGLTNPKYAFNWEVYEGLKIRGNYAESFVAPQFSTYGPDKLTGIDGRSVDSFFGPRNGILDVPLDRYPEARTIPGCDTPGQVTCRMGTAGIPGMQIDGANPDVGPATGENWAIGFDFIPPSIEGLSASFTFWSTDLIGAAGSPPLGIVINSTLFHDLLQIYPDGATPAEIESFRGDRRQRAPLASGPMYFGLDFLNYNVYTVYVEGIDFDVHYQHDFSWGMLRGGVAGTHKTRFDQTVGNGEPVFSVLNNNRFIGTFPTIETEMRFDISAIAGPIKATAFANYTAGYTFWGSSAINPVTLDNGIPSGGGDAVSSYTTVGLNLQYNLSDLLPGETTAFMDVDNLFDTYPPFVNFSNGYDNYTSFPMGRVITVGLRMDF